MGPPTCHMRTATDPPQGENLSGFLHRINFNLDSVVGGAPRKASSSSLNGVLADPFTSTRPPLQDRTNGSTSLLNLFFEDERHTSLQGVTRQSSPGSATPFGSRSSSLQGAHTVSATTKPLIPTKTDKVSAPRRDSQRSTKPKHELPVYALSQTLRASSIGATMAPGIPNDSSSLNWSKYAPAGKAVNDEGSKTPLNQRTAETIARQAEIDARLSKLRARRDPATEQRDEARRLQLMAAEQAASEKQARMKADRDVKKKEEEAELLQRKEEAERVKREQEEAERIRREKEEAERIKREQEEAERIKREREEAERLEREKAEAERLQREKEEAERIQREKEEAERIQREKAEAEEAALCAMLHDKIDEIEESGLTETQTEQLDLQKSIEDANTLQEETNKKRSIKIIEIEQAEEGLKLLKHEDQELQKLQASITAEIDTAYQKCAELQTVSEQMMERAAIMRKKVDDKSARSIDTIERFVRPGQTSRQAVDQAKLAPQSDEAEPDDHSPSESFQELDTSVEEVGVEISTDVKTSPESSTTEEGEIKELGAIEKQSPALNGKENLQDQLVFKKWPSQENRPFGGAQKRLVKLTNLPTTSSIATIQSFVWGGRIEKIDYTPGNTFAWVLFMRGEDCEKYFSMTNNGISHPEDSNRVIWVEMSDPVSVNEHLRGVYDAGHTRCVRAVGADEDWGQTALIRLASAKGRKLERIVNGANPKGLRVVEFRFSNIVDSARFKVELQNDIDWEHCNVYFGDDPCATNNGVHMGIH